MPGATSVLSCLALLVPAADGSIRPPAVPLIVHDPYFSVWSVTDQLAEGATRHWTGAEQPLVSLARIDGRTYRLMGNPSAIETPLPQERLTVSPTQTEVEFAGAGVSITLRFTTPTLPDDVDVLSRTATYLTWQAQSTDGMTHDVTVYFSADARLAVNDPSQEVIWDRANAGGHDVLRIGTVEQPILRKKGDNLRIDWGHLLVSGAGSGYLGEENKALSQFGAEGTLPFDEPSKPSPTSANIVAAFILPFSQVGAKAVSKHLIVAYDDLYSIQFMGHNLRPYWRRNGLDGLGLIQEAERDYAKLVARCDTFDKDTMHDLARIGGKTYAHIAALAYRQSLGAQKVVADANGQPLMFSKENFSNGCIATVDVLYPAAPLLLAFSPTLTKASLVPVLEYAASPRWKWPFAPHDLGTYPKANGQVYGGGERTEEDQMPVEESGNMLLILAALAHAEGNADFSAKYWPQLEKWAQYLADKGFDPERQLSTDDFAGHLAHNVNLSAKAIEALGAYAYLAGRLGKMDEAKRVRALAESFAHRWVEEGKSGDHYKLAFDRDDTWSQKYNLVWDRLLGINLFPASVAREELAFYRNHQHAYGLPLDNRADYTKLDWIVWTATLTPELADFQVLVDPIAKFLNDTPNRVPMSDWYMTSNAHQRGFQARSVVGGVFIKMLDDHATWMKYAHRDRETVGPWAALPTPPTVTEVVPSGEQKAALWHYTESKPGEGWEKPEFNTGSWSVGPAGFGHGPSPEGPTRTHWSTPDIWIRREFDLSEESVKKVQLKIEHDDDAYVYLNGVFLMHLPGAERYEIIELPDSARAALKSGRNLIAIHCHDTGGDSYIDAGFVTLSNP